MQQAETEVSSGTEIRIGGVRLIFPYGQNREDVDALRATLLYGARTLLDEVGIGMASDPIDMERLSAGIFMVDIARGLPAD